MWYSRRVQKLRKSDRRHFEDVCRRLREQLHLEHWRCDYRFTDKDEDAIASYNCPKSLGNRRVWIDIHKPFWEYDGDEQLRTLIHEHVHAILSPYEQALVTAISEMHPSDKPWATHLVRSGMAEIVTDHLEAVLYDLLHSRIP